MSLADALRDNAPPPRRNGKCKVGKALDAMRDDPDFPLLEKTMGAGRDYPAARLALVFEAMGHQVSPSLVNLHRKAYCVCGGVPG